MPHQDDRVTRSGQGVTDAASGAWHLVPGLHRLRHYERGWLRPDVLAGIAVAAYLLPQVMAYAEVAGLPPVVGFWAIGAALLAYAVFGSSRQLSVGPESTTALMTAVVIAPLAAGDPSRYAALAAALALVVGGLCLMARVARLGFLADLLSKPVLVGYMAGIAVLMIVSQLEKVTGVPVTGDSVLAELASFAGGLDQLHPATTLLSVGVLVLLLVVQRRFPRAPAPLIGMVVASAAVAVLSLADRGVRLVGDDSRAAARRPAARGRVGRPRRSAGPGARRDDRRLRRQRPDRARLRHPQRLPDRRRIRNCWPSACPIWPPASPRASR